MRGVWAVSERLSQQEIAHRVGASQGHGGSLTGLGTSQGFAITFGGNFTLVGGGPGVSAAGTWNSSSGQTGTWNGSKTN